MTVFASTDYNAHEIVSHFHDPASGLRAIVAVHSTVLGPAFGGCRMYPYADDEAALADALRLSRAMTYKAALAGVPFGGGKAVIIGDPARDKSDALLTAMARFIDSFGGRYQTADDVGTTVGDMAVMRRITPYARGLADAAGEPCPATAWGTYHGLRAVARHRFGRRDLAGLSVAIQGLGSVGWRLAGYLAADGVRLVVSDIRPEAVARAVRAFGATAVTPDRILFEDVDILSPNALGAVFDDRTIPQLRARAIAGAANNQLARPEHGRMLAARGITYAPDYVVNAGGLIDVAHEGPGYDPQTVLHCCAGIAETVAAVLRRADRDGAAPADIADRMAEECLAAGADADKPLVSPGFRPYDIGALA
ncbi:MAG: amino acid dehydrogenase [Alphaproteobacteria bacterium]|jgi:leucine dehydrogenase|nr:amino acid dehydrogenase [Alphaproteobacteria bacterium]